MTAREDDVVIHYDLSRVPFPLERDPAPAPKVGGRARARRPLSPEHERYRVFGEDELNEFPPVEWFVNGFLAIGELTVLYGKGDTYKSFVALDWACHLAHEDVLVLYVAAEGASGIKARIAAWRRHYGVAELPNLKLMPSNVNLHDRPSVSTFVAALAEQLDGRLPGLIVIDTLARNFVGGNESSPQDMGLFVEGVEHLRRALRSAVLVIHHSTKDGTSERGTESLRNASFAMFEFKRVNQATQVTVTCDRMKDAEPPTPVTLRPTKIELPELREGVSSLVARWPYDRGDSRLSVPAAEPESGANLSRRDRQVLGVIVGAKDGANLETVMQKTKQAKRTASRHVNALVERGFVAAEGATRDRRFVATDAGREAVR